MSRRTDRVALLALPVGFVLFPSSGFDDRYITFWAARTLAHGGLIDWVGEGEVVELDEHDAQVWKLTIAPSQPIYRGRYLPTLYP